MKAFYTLLILMIPFVGFGQGCHYGSSTDASELCDFYRGNNFSTYKNADIALNKILDVTGMSKRFVLQECNDISNCIATSYNGIRYILYDRDFMDEIAKNTNSWSSLSILAHEIGHHVNGHSLDLVIYAAKSAEAPTLVESRQMELEADEYSGFVMYKLGASLSQAQDAVRLVSTNKDDSYSTHPKLDKRLSAIETGYNKAKNQYLNSSVVESNINDDEIENFSENSLEPFKEVDMSFYDEYFYNYLNNVTSDNPNIKYQLNNLNKAMELAPNFILGLYYRGRIYYNLGNYNDAISDFTKHINLCIKSNNFVPEFRLAYSSLGYSYEALGELKSAIDNYTKFIELFPEDDEIEFFYYSRGLVNYQMSNFKAAIADFSKCISLVPSDERNYVGRAEAYFSIEKYSLAIDDYTRAINLSSTISKGVYWNRGVAKQLLNYPKSEYCNDFEKEYNLFNKISNYNHFKKFCE